MVWKVVSNSDAGDSDHHGGNDGDKISNLFNGVSNVDTVDINSLWTFRDDKLKLRNPANTFSYIHSTSAITSSDKTVTWPLLTGNDQITFDAHTTTLSNKFMDYSDNAFALRLYPAIVIKKGSTYYAKRAAGTLITSGSVAEDVIQAALDEVPFGTVYIGTGVYDMSVGFTGLEIQQGQWVILENGVNINCPSGYTGYVWRALDVGFGGGLIGGLTGEQEPIDRNYKGLVIESADPDIGCTGFMCRDHYFYKPGTGITFKCVGGVGFVNSCHIENCWFDAPRIVAKWERNGANVEGNSFYFCNAQAETGITTDGYKDIDSRATHIVGCWNYDFESGMSGFNTLSTADGTRIDGGEVVPGNGGDYEDLGKNTILNDRRAGTWLDGTNYLGGYPLTITHKSSTIYDEAGIDFKLFNADDELTESGFIGFAFSDVTAGAENGVIDISLVHGGVVENAIYYEDRKFYIGPETKLGFDPSNQSSGHVMTFPNSNSLLIGNDSTDVTLADGKDFALGSSSGTKIGTATGQKIGFYNATPVNQRTGIADVDTSTVDNTYGQQENDVITSLRTKVNAIIQVLEDLGLTAVV